MAFRSIQRFDGTLGFSCVYRQHRALVGSTLRAHVIGFEFTFEATELDDSRLVLAHGATNPLHTELTRWYADRLIVAHDDPYVHLLSEMNDLGLAGVVQMDYVGCEAFAKQAWNLVRDFLRISGLEWRVKCVEAKCFDAGCNSAVYIPQPTSNN